MSLVCEQTSFADFTSYFFLSALICPTKKENYSEVVKNMNK